MKYQMMTAREAIEELFKLDKRRTLSFTFDDLDIDPECEPSGWFGMRLMKIFDEEDYVFVMGYYGGGSTESYDIYGMVDDSYNIDRVKEYCTARLQNFMNTWCDSFEPCEKICVEIEETMEMADLRVEVDGGCLQATVSGDKNYPGIYVEFVADNNTEEKASRPTVLVEKPVDDELRVLIWSDEDDEDYTTEVKFK